LPLKELDFSKATSFYFIDVLLGIIEYQLTTAEDEDTEQE
jgi:hypothetical protein